MRQLQSNHSSDVSTASTKAAVSDAVHQPLELLGWRTLPGADAHRSQVAAADELVCTPPADPQHCGRLIDRIHHAGQSACLCVHG
jgi:hypothetical protein